MAIAIATGNAAFAIAVAVSSGVSISTLPATHSAARAINQMPVGVGRFVQLRTAVSRKPAITAVVYPNSISWACHTDPSRYTAGTNPEYCATQSSTLKALKTLASR